MGVAFVSCTSERTTRRYPSDYGSVACDQGVDGLAPCGEPGQDQQWSVIEFEDDPNNASFEECDTGNIQSPGADIDAAELNGGTYLAGCQVANMTSCQSDSLSAANAEGAPDASGSEEIGTYTSLNGGLLRCIWDNDAAVTTSDSITVIEIAESSGAYIDQYRIRLCDAVTGQCNRNSPYASGEVSLSGSDLF